MTGTETALIEIGMSVWALNSDDTDADMRSVQGGTVVSIETDTDRDTGEIQRRFVTATPWRGAVRFDFVNAGQVAQVAPMNVAAVRALIRTAAGVVAKAKRVFTTDEARCIALQHELMRILS